MYHFWLTVHLLKDIWVVSCSWLLWIKWLQTFVCGSCEQKTSGKEWFLNPAAFMHFCFPEHYLSPQSQLMDTACTSCQINLYATIKRSHQNFPGMARVSKVMSASWEGKREGSVPHPSCPSHQIQHEFLPPWRPCPTSQGFSPFPFWVECDHPL